MKLEDFVKEAAIDLSVTKTTRLDFRYDSPTEWGRDARHWQVTLFRSVEGEATKRRLPVEYTQGSAHKKPPTGLEVLQSLLMDTQGFEGQTFEEWASNYGYDEDSRSAEKIYFQIVAEANRLKAWLGLNLYNKFINCDCDF